MIGVHQSFSTLAGIFVYYNTSHGEQQADTVTIAGVRTESGEFCADATLQVRKTSDDDWEPAGHAAGDGQRTTVSAAAGGDSGVFVVDLSYLKPFITTHRFGSCRDQFGSCFSIPTRRPYSS
jgi:hypothetical protein